MTVVVIWRIILTYDTTLQVVSGTTLKGSFSSSTTFLGGIFLSTFGVSSTKVKLELLVFAGQQIRSESRTQGLLRILEKKEGEGSECGGMVADSRRAVTGRPSRKCSV